MNDPSIQLSIWYALGVTTDESTLIQGPVFSINPGLPYNGGGYFVLQNVFVPGWTAGDVTLQLRGGGYSTELGYEVFGRSVLWTSSEFVDTGLPANTSAQVPQLILIPEPSTYALAGLGLAVLILARQRKGSDARIPGRMAEVDSQTQPAQSN